MDEAFKWAAQRTVEKSQGNTMTFTDGTAVRCESKWSEPLSEVTPDVDALPPLWSIGKPDQKHLFIGGALDGRWIAAGDATYYCCWIDDKTCHQYYRRELLGSVFFWNEVVEPEWPPSEHSWHAKLLARLIERYKA